MKMVLAYKDAWRSRAGGEKLSVNVLRGPKYANTGTGYSGGTSWEEHRLSFGLNKWLGRPVYRQKAFPTPAAFDQAVRNSFVTGNPVLVDTIENWRGPHYNGHVGLSSHIIVAYQYNKADGTVGFRDPAGPGSAIPRYGKSASFDYNNARKFATNFLGNYGGGGHGMVY